MGDIPMELVNEVMLTITDPAAMLGPEVGNQPICPPASEGGQPETLAHHPRVFPDEPTVGQRCPG